MSQPVSILVLFYSLYGHTYNLATAVAEGVASVEGCQAIMMQVREKKKKKKKEEKKSGRKKEKEKEKKRKKRV